jgi:hypothetical protein
MEIYCRNSVCRLQWNSVWQNETASVVAVFVVVSAGLRVNSLLHNLCRDCVTQTTQLTEIGVGYT